MADKPSPPLSPRPSPPSGEPLPQDNSTVQRPQSLAELYAHPQSVSELRRQIHTLYPVTPPPSPIRRSYRSRTVYETSSCPNIQDFAQIRHTMEMDKTLYHISAVEQALEECSNKEEYTDDECIRQQNLFTRIGELKNTYKAMQKVEDIEFPIRFVRPLKKSMKRRSHSH